MDLRSLIQLLACFIVGMVLFYQFEVVPNITVTWDDPNYIIDQIPNDQFIYNLQDNYEDYDTELNDINEIEYNFHILDDITLQEKEINIKPDNILISNIKTDNINDIPNNPNALTFTVTLPDKIHECFKAEIKLTTSENLSYIERIDIMKNIIAELKCSHAENPFLEFTRILPFSPGRNAENSKFYSIFFPDRATGFCTINVKSLSNDIQLSGQTIEDYIVQDIHSSRPYCWACVAHIHNAVPLAYHFLLKDDEGIYLFGKTKMTIQRYSVVDLWIVPHPLLLEEYPDMVKKILFNGYLESETIIQGVDISDEFNEEKGGYKLTITGKDAGELKLYVVLNWIFPNSEVRTDDPEPILTSSHIDHSDSFCDFERSEIYDSQFTIVVESQATYLFPSPPKKCTNSMENGRWLNVIPRETECRTPFCTGDRFSTFISSMSWQGHKFEWLWIPYECHYHYYTREDFTYCAKEKNIKWIHVMGDSLSREIVSYLMSYFDILDTTKFDHADVILNESDVRITFQSWTDILAQPRDHEGPRDHEFIEKMIDHYNLREADTSSKIHINNEIVNLYLEKEETSPDIFIFNAANAYALYLQKEEEFESFVKDFTEYCDDIFINGRIGDKKKTKAYWYGNPYLHGTAHGGTEFITQSRNAKFNDIARPLVENIGITYFDVIHLTQSRPFESWDGLHYLRGYERWNGHVASTFIQNFLNEIFGDCTGPNPINEE